jgi:L-iditol 2-dehydrogenase
MSSMLAVMFYKPGEVKLEHVPIPRAGPGELVAKCIVTLTCGTDVKMYKRGHRLVKPPQIVGHEFAGVVTEVGEGVKAFNEGMRIAAANSAPCNKCFYCLTKQPNLCEHLDESLIGFSWPGSYAEYVRIPERIVRQNTFVIGDQARMEHVASLEPLACVVHGWDLASLEPGGTAVVIGGGPIGLLHLQLARLRGAKQVVMCDVVDQRLEEAKKVGVEVITLNPSKEDMVRRIEDLTGGRGAEIVIEAVGRKETWESTSKLVRKGGMILLFGGCPGGTNVTFDADKMHYGELRIQGAFHHTPSAVERAFNLIASNRISIGPLISQDMPLERAEEALQLMSEGKSLKIALRPPK